MVQAVYYRTAKALDIEICPAAVSIETGIEPDIHTLIAVEHWLL